MEKNYEFLTTIVGKFPTIDSYDDFHNSIEIEEYDTLTIFHNIDECAIKICYNSIKSINGKSKLYTGEILLKNIGFMEYELIRTSYENPIIKELIFAKYMDMDGRTIDVDKIY